MALSRIPGARKFFDLTSRHSRPVRRKRSDAMLWMEVLEERVVLSDTSIIPMGPHAVQL